MRLDGGIVRGLIVTVGVIAAALDKDGLVDIAASLRARGGASGPP